MSYVDKILHCADCGTDFAFTTEEQEAFAARGYTNEPKRCPACRGARKARQDSRGFKSYGARRQMFPAVCTECGKETQVPFEPREGRPVYCSACYNPVTLSSRR